MPSLSAERLSCRLAAWMFAAVVMFGGACGRGESGPPETSAPAVSEADLFLLDLTGVWTVVGHHMPGTSAMADADAKAWTGQTIRLAEDEAISGSERCAAPIYATRVVATDEFLAQQFHLPPRSLSPLAEARNIAVLETSCDSRSWTAMGARLIAVHADRALAPWDGVFFEMKRVPADR